MVDLPSKSMKWLDPHEVQFLEIQRKIKQGGIKADGSDIEGGELGIGSWHEFKMISTNWRMWMIAYICMCQAAALYGKWMGFLANSLNQNDDMLTHSQA